MKLGPKLLALALLPIIAGCTDDAPSMDETVRMNEIQVLGSHNSYHSGIPKDVFELLTAFDKATAESLDYHHGPLDEQLDDGARQLELDVFADPDGGRYADRHVMKALGKPVATDIPALKEPGFKVFHVQEIDFESVCVTFVECLQQVKAWSSDNPTHLPIMILVEAKDGLIPDPANLGFVTPVPIDAAQLDALDAEIASVFERDEMVLPADVTDDGWPTLAASRGKVWFALDNEALATMYTGTTLFTTQPDATAPGFAKLNDPIGDADKIRSLVEKGFIVRTRADADTVQSRTNDPTMREAAIASGAQYISSDYLTADPRFSDYHVELPGGVHARCNPVNAPPECEDDQLKA
jgi:hypothetical protein